MTKIDLTLELPDKLAREAEAAGLLRRAPWRGCFGRACAAVNSDR
ncbi:MAG TPA: hypothetical protein VD846_02735 [Allosphingosinicella sp.]|nr:hypothetical protein [Allosphingosinicella sp.]